MFLSFLPILSAVFALCLGVGFLVISRFLADNAYALAGLSFLVLLVVLTPGLGGLAYRFLARAFPLQASAQPDPVSLRRLRFGLVATVAVCLGLAAWAWSLTSVLTAPPGLGSLSARFEEALLHVSAYIELSLCAVLLLFSVCVTWGFIKVIRFHGRPEGWASEDFVLFLRSFGSVSDSAALGVLVRAAGVRSRLALLSSPSEVTASWDPMTLAVAGFSVRHPFHSVPVYLKSTEDSWADDVRRLATAANLVVIDMSHRSPGLSREVHMLSELGLGPKTLRFEEAPEGDPAEKVDASPDDLFFVEPSPFGRRVSQVLGFVFTYLGFVILTGLVLYPIDPTLSSKLGSLVSRASLLYSVVPAVYAASVLSPAAGFTRRSSAELFQAIRQRASSLDAVDSEFQT
jgi:hypothetical protein